VPAALVGAVASVRVLVAWPTRTVTGSNVAVTPAPSPLTASNTGAANPPLREMVIVTFAVAPCTMETAETLAMPKDPVDVVPVTDGPESLPPHVTADTIERAAHRFARRCTRGR
jgi:hypothetical protein